jgi:ABC-2 type transport system ATP-binding protein/lipopolysaccharide transport system ATP-binding protein
MDYVEFDRVSKRYMLGQRTSAREAVTAAASGILGRRCRTNQELWSLRDVSFTVAEGEALGIIGRNGAGKSTILKILAGITVPTTGVSRTRGRVAALLEVGTGFHPELSGRENMYLNGAILGMSRQDVTRRFDEIVEFSGVERFLDTPVKRFSSGMYLRLAFAIAAHLDPDVLVIDEILAVGDAEFQRRCLTRVEEAEREGRTVIFVSHDLEAVGHVCQRSLWLESGELRGSGPTHSMVRKYLASGLDVPGAENALIRSGPIVVRSVRVLPAREAASGPIMRDDAFRIRIEFEVRELVGSLNLAVYVTSSGGVRILDEALRDTFYDEIPAGRYRAELHIPPMLNVGDYTVGLWFGTEHEDILDEPVVAPFTIYGGDLRRPDRAVILKLPFVVEQLGASDA